MTAETRQPHSTIAQYVNKQNNNRSLRNCRKLFYLKNAANKSRLFNIGGKSIYEAKQFQG